MLNRRQFIQAALAAAVVPQLPADEVRRLVDEYERSALVIPIKLQAGTTYEFSVNLLASGDCRTVYFAVQDSQGRIIWKERADTTREWQRVMFRFPVTKSGDYEIALLLPKYSQDVQLAEVGREENRLNDSDPLAIGDCGLYAAESKGI